MSTAHRRSLSSTTQPLIVGGKLYLGYRAAENTGAPIALTSTHGSWGPGFYYPNLRENRHQSVILASTGTSLLLYGAGVGSEVL